MTVVNVHGPVHVTFNLETTIRNRIEELKQRRTSFLAMNHEEREIHRLEGNIGALEWVLREANCKQS